MAGKRALERSEKGPDKRVRDHQLNPANAPNCYRCNGNGDCVRCDCVKSGRVCTSCLQGKKDRCRNSDQPTPTSYVATDIKNEDSPPSLQDVCNETRGTSYAKDTAEPL